MAPGLYNQSYFRRNSYANFYHSSGPRSRVAVSPLLQKNMDAKKPTMAKEVDETLQNLGFTNPLRTVNNSTRDDGELISDKIPTDCNVGRSTSIRESIAAAMGSMHQSKPKRTASSELLKIEDLENYKHACTEYDRARKEGWNEARLLDLVRNWQEIDERGSCR